MDVNAETTPPREPPHRPPVRGRRLWLFRLVALGMGLLFGLVAVETAVRIVMAARPNDIEALRRFEQRKQSGETLLLRDLVRISRNPRLIYEFVPGIEGEFKGVPVRINSAGFRDPERTTRKPANTWRMAALGDSILFGWGVPEETRFTNLLEKFLNETGDGTRFEVLNFGVPGYNTVTEEELLRSVAAPYAPDAVLLSFCLENDHTLPNFVAKPRPLMTLRHSFALELARSRSTSRIRGALRPELEGVRKDHVPDEYRHMVGADNCLAALARMGGFAGAKRWPALFVLDYWLFDPWLPPNTRPLDEDPGTTVTRAATAAGFVEVSTLAHTVDYLKSHGLGMRSLWITDEDAHPNPVRHALVAREIYREMVQRGILPDSAARRGALADHLARWDEIVAVAASRTVLPPRSAEIGTESLDYDELWGGPR